MLNVAVLVFTDKEVWPEPAASVGWVPHSSSHLASPAEYLGNAYCRNVGWYLCYRPEDVSIKLAYF